MRPTRRRHPWSFGCVSLATLVACNGDDAPSGMDDTGTTSSITITDTFPMDSSGTTGNVATETSATTIMADSTSGGEPGCETILCGGVCCEVGEECVNEQCLPECETEIRCGENQEICCDEGQVCLANDCATPTGPCTDAYDCAEGEFCEPTLDQCLPQPNPLDCEILPDFQDIELTEEWTFESEQVISMPAVGDIDGDMQPEVVINTYYATDPGGASSVFYGEIIVLDGTDGSEQFRVQNDPGSATSLSCPT